MSAAGDTRTLIETAIRRFVEEVPALANLKLVLDLELRGRGDVQAYRVELPGPKISKQVADDAKVRLEIPRSHFNELATKGHVSDWVAAFEKGAAKAAGSPQIQRLIAQVVERSQERARTKKVRR